MSDQFDDDLEEDQIEVEAEAEEVAAEPAKPEWDDETEAEARAFGWKPSTEWEGKVPAGFIDDPRRYMERAENFGPFKKLRERQAQADEALRKLESVTAAQVKRAREQAEAQHKRDLDAITQQQRRAVEEADTDAYDRLEKQRATLKAPEPEPEAPKFDREAAERKVKELHGTHPWLADPFLRQQAAQVIDLALMNGAVKGEDAAEQAAYAEGELKKYFPHLFTAPKTTPKASPVDGGGLAGGVKRSGFDGLPSDAKAAFKRMVAQGTFADTKEDREFYFDEYSNA